MSLRARLLVLLLVLLGVGLVVSGVVTTALLRNYLVNRIDNQMRAVLPAAQQQFGPGPGGQGGQGDHGDDHGGPGGSPGRGGDTDLRVARIDSSGNIVSQLGGAFASSTTAFQAVPKATLTKARTAGSATYDGTLAGAHYRVRAQTLASGDVLVVLAPLHDLDQTLGRLRVIEGLVAVGLLGVAALVSSRLVRVGLRPLRDMADTADAIAGGDIERRIAPGGGAEVASLGAALNKAFDSREASESKLRTFIADASHELRTPLTSIRGYAELLRTGAADAPEDHERAVVRIESEAARMGGLVEDMLTLARLDQGRPLERGPVDLSALAADAVADAAAVDPARQVILVAPEQVVANADDSRMRQVLANLLANARQHTPAGTHIEVRVGAVDGAARVDVRDDGPGIPPAAAAHVFDRFWRADLAHSRGGAGLGLAIVAALASAHGGRAWLEPADRGAHFVVSVPLYSAKPGGTA